MNQKKYIYRTSLPKVLRSVIPELIGQAKEIDSEELSANADKSRYVYLHRLYDGKKNNVLSLIEKTSNTRWPNIDPEVFFYSELQKISEDTVSPPYYGSMTTRHGTHIFLEHLQGAHPNLADIATEIAQCIANIELATSPNITRLSFSKNRGYLLFDFFFRFHRFEKAIRAQLDTADAKRVQDEFHRLTGQSMELCKKADNIIKFLNQESKTIRKSTKCFSHMDFRAQNVIYSGEQLYLLDWGTAKIGRIGFDAGAFLTAILMRQGVEPFRRTADNFLAAYRNLISPHFSWDAIQRNCNYIFLARSLSYFLKPAIIDRHINTKRIDTLISKHQYLISLFNSIK